MASLRLIVQIVRFLSVFFELSSFFRNLKFLDNGKLPIGFTTVIFLGLI